MRKITLLKTIMILLVAGLNNVNAQNPYKFLKVNYVGAMGTTDWTKNWTNWNPEQTTYGSPTETTTLNAISNGTGVINITTDVTLDASKVYLLTGIVYVKSGATLNIPAGTIIRAEGDPSATPANWAVIVVQRGGKLNCTGTVDKPVVFTSNKAAGSRKPGDWGGIILLGKGLNNLPGGQAGCTSCGKGEGLIEGPFGYPDGAYGGSDDADNSGALTFVRIEFPGLVFSANNEINGLTLGSVGYGTLLRNIQVSYSNDDSYEWFGGAASSKYLVAFKGTDDDFDTDFGYHGLNQFGIGFKDSLHFDPTYGAPSGASTSEGFESDNDGSGSTSRPKTTAVFSNYTMVGPYAAGETFAQHSKTVQSAYRRGARIRRNSAESIINSIFMGYRNGVMLDGAATEGNANIATGATACDTLIFRNNILLGMTSPLSATATGIVEVASGRDTGAIMKWVKASANKINPVAWSAGTLLTDPNNYTNPNFLPVAGSPALTMGADFDNCKLINNEAGITKFLNKSDYKVYPNPANGSTNVSINLVNRSFLTVSILGVDGRIVQTQGGNFNSGNTVLTFNDLKAGIYIVNIRQNDAMVNYKLIVR